MKHLFIFFFAAKCLFINAQTFTQEVNASGGGYYQQINGSMQFTFGVPLVETYTPTRAGKKAEIAVEIATKQKTVHTIADISTNTNHSMFIPEEETVATVYEKAKLYPNPNNGTMSFEYNLSEFEKGQLSIYDVTGRKIVDYKLSTGNKIITVSETSLNNGIYFYIYKVNDVVQKSEKIVIIK